MTNHDTSIMEARTALPLAGGVKCRHPERVEDGGNRSITTALNTHKIAMAPPPGTLPILGGSWVRKVEVETGQSKRKRK